MKKIIKINSLLKRALNKVKLLTAPQNYLERFKGSVVDVVSPLVKDVSKAKVSVLRNVRFPAKTLFQHRPVIADSRMMRLMRNKGIPIERTLLKLYETKWRNLLMRKKRAYLNMKDVSNVINKLTDVSKIQSAKLKKNYHRIISKYKRYKSIHIGKHRSDERYFKYLLQRNFDQRRSWYLSADLHRYLPYVSERKYPKSVGIISRKDRIGMRYSHVL